MDNAGNQGLEAEFVENSDEEEVAASSMDFQTGSKTEDTIVPVVDRDTKLKNMANVQKEKWNKILPLIPEEELQRSSSSAYHRSFVSVAYNDVRNERSEHRIMDIINGYDVNPHWLPTGKKESAFQRIKEKPPASTPVQVKTPVLNGSFGTPGSSTPVTTSTQSSTSSVKKEEIMLPAELDSWGLPKFTDEEWKTLMVLRRIKSRGLWEVDPKQLLPVKLKEDNYYIDYFTTEQRFIAKEEKILSRWRKKMIRKVGGELVKVVRDRQQSIEGAAKEEENLARNTCSQLASMVNNYWDKLKQLFKAYEDKLLDEAKKKKRENQLLSVIDKSSTLTRLMIPGVSDSPEKQLTSRSPKLEEDFDDMEGFLKSLPPEYLEALSKEMPSNESFINSPESEITIEMNEEKSEEIPRRRSTRSKSSASIGTESEKSMKSNDDENEIESDRRRSLRSHDVKSPLSPPKPVVNGSTRMESETPITNESESSLSPELGLDDSTVISSPTRQIKPAAVADNEMNDLAKIADSFRPTGSTYETAKVKTSVPTILDAKLREYQHIGLDWLASLFGNKLNGILADEMGLGKTVQTIAFLAYLAEEKQIWGPHLIVVPTSVLLNWEREFKRFCPSLKVLTYFGSTKERSEKRKGWKKANAFNVCITTYDLYIRDTRMFKWRAWQCLVLDEAHNIKNSKSLRWNKLLSLRTRIRILLTGTPLQNNLMELWSLLYFLMPSVFASQDDFKNWFNDPMNAMIEGSVEYNARIIDKLHTVLRPFILRRLKSEVEKQMPLKLERVVYCPLSRLQRNLYNAFLRQRSTIESIKGGSAISVMNIVMQLRKCCNHPNLFIPITCKTPMRLPSLSLNFPLAVKEPEINKAEVILEMMKDDFVDMKGNLNPKNPKKCIKIEKKDVIYMCGESSKEFPFNFTRKTSYFDLSLDTAPTLSDAASQKVRWLWNVTKEIRDLLKPNEPQKSMIYEPCERIIENEMEKLVHRYGFAPFEVFGNLPQSNICEPIGVEEEKLYDEAIKTEDELTSYIYYSSIVECHDPRLVELDCGKLRMLSKLLRQLKLNGHRCLIFTQMSKMLDILEIFLTHQKHMYFRLDGSTPIQQRQVLMDRFNADDRIFAFILSTRSGGIGMNLTGADTVIFYDSDWNPTMDAQAQDRCHRIGQTRNVVIYRLISSSTIEENILKRAFHKRKLGEMALDEGEFTPNFAEKANVRELFQGEEALQDVLEECNITVNEGELEKVMYKVEDPNDVKAAEELRKELGQNSGLIEDEFEEMLQNQLTPVQRFCFNWFKEEHKDVIENKLKEYESTHEAETETNGSDMDIGSEEEDDEQSMKAPMAQEIHPRKRPPRRSNGGPPRKRVRFTGVKTRSR